MQCTNVSCKHFRNKKDVDYSRVSLSSYFSATKLPLVSDGICRYSYCKLNDRKAGRK